MDREDRRQFVRKPLVAEGRVLAPDGGRIRCMLQNISEGGAMAVLAEAVDLPPFFVFEIPGNFAIVRRCRLAWRDGLYIGMEFVDRAKRRHPRAAAA